MKASKLVSELQAIMNHQGDFEVRIDLGEPDQDKALWMAKDYYSVVDVVPDFKYIWLAVR